MMQSHANPTRYPATDSCPGFNLNSEIECSNGSRDIVFFVKKVQFRH